MRFSHFFIDRPIFASVLSLIILIVGGIAQFRLPVAEYPEIAPPTVNDHRDLSRRLGRGDRPDRRHADRAGGQRRRRHALHRRRSRPATACSPINVVFKPGVDIDQAQVLVQNRVAVAQPRLPEDVQRLGIVVRKASPDLMMVVHMVSPDGSRDQQYISNYATLYVKDVLTRVEGVGNVHGVRRARLLHARLARSRARRRPQHDGRRGGAGDPRRQPAGRRRRHQPGAGRVARRLHPVGADARPPHRARGVRQHRAARRDRRLGDAAARRRRASSSARRTTRSTPTSTTRTPPRSRIFQRPGSNALSTSDGVKAAMEEPEEELPARHRLHGRLQSDRVHPGLGRRGDRDAVRGAAAGRDRGDPVPADLAGRDHSR